MGMKDLRQVAYESHAVRNASVWSYHKVTPAEIESNHILLVFNILNVQRVFQKDQDPDISSSENHAYPRICLNYFYTLLLFTPKVFLVVS